MSRLATLVFIGFVAVGVLVGQTRAEEPHKAWWDFLKGDWTWQISPLGTEGTVTWSSAAKGDVLVGRFEGSDGTSSIEVSGYRSDTQTLAVYGFGSQGSCWQLDLKQASAEGIAGPHSGTLPDGRTFKGEFVGKRIDNDHFNWQTKAKTDDGEELDLTGKVVRVRKQASDVTVEDFVHYYKPLLGSWEMTVEVAGKSFHGRTNWRLGSNKKCLLIDSESEIGAAGQSLQGFDVTTGTWQMARFDNEGHFTIATLDHTTIEPGTTMSVGVIGNWNEPITVAGKTTTRTSEISCLQLDAERIVLEWKYSDEDQNGTQSVRITMDRLQGPQGTGTPSLAADKDEPGADYEQLKQLEWLVGDWEGEMVIPAESMPEIYPEGATVKSKQSFFWMQNKSYIGMTFRDEIDGKLHHEAFEMIGVDPVSKKLIHWIFSVAGGHGAGEWSVDGKTCNLNWWGVLPNKARYEGTSYMVSVDADTHTWQIRGMTRVGKAVPDYPKATFHRVKSLSSSKQQQASSEKDSLSTNYQKHRILEDLSVGSWAISGTSEGADIEGKLVGKWAPEKYCVMFSGHFQPASGGTTTHISGVIGWDNETEKIKEQLFFSNGFCATTYFDVQGKVLVGKRHGINADGNKFSQDLQFTVGANRWVAAPSADIGSDGEPMTEYGEWVFTRVQ